MITVPAIKYSHRVLKDIGHNVPQEAPGDFAKAVLDVAVTGMADNETILVTGPQVNSERSGEQ